MLFFFSRSLGLMALMVLGSMMGGCTPEPTVDGGLVTLDSGLVTPDGGVVTPDGGPVPPGGGHLRIEAGGRNGTLRVHVMLHADDGALLIHEIHPGPAYEGDLPLIEGGSVTVVTESELREGNLPNVNGATWYGVADGDTLRFGELRAEGTVRIELPPAFPDATYYRVIMCNAEVAFEGTPEGTVELPFDSDCMRLGLNQVIVLALAGVDAMLAHTTVSDLTADVGTVVVPPWETTFDTASATFAAETYGIYDMAFGFTRGHGVVTPFGFGRNVDSRSVQIPRLPGAMAWVRFEESEYFDSISIRRAFSGETALSPADLPPFIPRSDPTTPEGDVLLATRGWYVDGDQVAWRRIGPADATFIDVDLPPEFLRLTPTEPVQETFFVIELPATWTYDQLRQENLRDLLLRDYGGDLRVSASYPPEA